MQRLSSGGSIIHAEIVHETTIHTLPRPALENATTVALGPTKTTEESTQSIFDSSLAHATTDVPIPIRAHDPGLSALFVHASTAEGSRSVPVPDHRRARAKTVESQILLERSDPRENEL